MSRRIPGFCMLLSELWLWTKVRVSQKNEPASAIAIYCGAKAGVKPQKKAHEVNTWTWWNEIKLTSQSVEWRLATWDNDRGFSADCVQKSWQLLKCPGPESRRYSPSTNLHRLHNFPWKLGKLGAGSVDFTQVLRRDKDEFSEPKCTDIN